MKKLFAVYLRLLQIGGVFCCLPCKDLPNTATNRVRWKENGRFHPNIINDDQHWTNLVTQQKFATLMQTHQKLIYKVCHLYTDRPEDVEDLFQEILLNLWRAYPKFSGQSKFSTWLYRIALNTAITQLRKAKRQQQYEVPLILEQLQVETAVKQEDQLRTLYNAIRQLNKVEKAVVFLYLEDRSYQEIGEILGISESNVGAKLTRIRHKLRTLTKEQSNES